MGNKISLLILGLLVGLATPVAADNPKASKLDLIKSKFAGKTIRFNERDLNLSMGSLNQRLERYIVFFDPDGTAHIWITSQRQVHATSWKTYHLGFFVKKNQTSEGQKLPISGMCLGRFPTKGELCRGDGLLAISMQEVADGDILDLRSLTVPCRLCRADVDFSSIRKIKGGS